MLLAVLPTEAEAVSHPISSQQFAIAIPRLCRLCNRKCAAIDLAGNRIAKALVWTLLIIVLDIGGYSAPQFLWAVVFVDIDIFPFQVPEPSLYDYIVYPSRFAVQALPDAVLFEKRCILLACELGPLITTMPNSV